MAKKDIEKIPVPRLVRTNEDAIAEMNRLREIIKRLKSELIKHDNRIGDLE